MRWISRTFGGPRRVNHAAVEVGGKIYSFGGYCTGDNYKDPRPIDVFVLDTRNFRWSEIPKPDLDEWLAAGQNQAWPRQRYGHSVVAYKDKIHLFGGRADNFISHKVHVFNTQTGTWSVPSCTGVIPPTTRDGHSACLIGKSMYIFGGYAELFFGGRIGNLLSLDLETYTWTLLAAKGEVPPWRDFHTATAVRDRMYVFGGRCVNSLWADESDEYYQRGVTYLDVKTMTWVKATIEEMEPAPEGRRSHSAINVDDNILIFGGFNSGTGQHMNDMWLFNTDRCTWQKVQPGGEPPNPRRRQVMILSGSKIFLFGGTCQYDGPSIIYSDEQLSHMPPVFMNSMKNLIDLNDLHVLDLRPTLRTLCAAKVLEVIKSKDETLEADLEEIGMPRSILDDLMSMYMSNTISKPLQSKLTSG